jgi:hypothetical protein
MNQVREKSSFLFKGPSSVPLGTNTINNSSTLDMNRLTIFQENERGAAGRGDEQDEDTPRKRMRMTTDDGRQEEEDEEEEEQDTEEDELPFVHNNSSIAVVESQYPMNPPATANLGYVSDLHQARSSVAPFPVVPNNNLLMKMPTTFKTPLPLLNNTTNPFPTPSSSSPVTNGVTSTTTSSSTSNSQKPSHPVPVPVQVKPILPFSLKIVRFERIGLSEWDIKEIRVFDLQSFLQNLLSNNNNNGGSNDLTIFLLNEKRLHSLLSEKKLSITNSSISISPSACKLEDELTSGYKAVVTSWPQYDFLQFQHFLTSYETHFNSHTHAEPSSTPSSSAHHYNNLSLYRFWSQFNETVKTEESSNHSNTDENDATDKTGNKTASISNSSSNNSIIGYIGYEITIHLVLVVRKNISLGIKTDIWCKIFPNEFLQTSQEIRASLLLENNNNNNNHPVVVTFGQILMNFFPQLNFIEKKLQQLNNSNLSSSNSNNNNPNHTMPLTMNDILVKYYSFSHQNKQSETTKTNQITGNTNTSNNNNNLVIPDMVSYQYYQTIGTLQTPANKVMTRYVSLVISFLTEKVFYLF